jgi:alkylation response protein AidB-like acyl-CoA dehydrogenase
MGTPGRAKIVRGEVVETEVQDRGSPEGTGGADLQGVLPLDNDLVARARSLAPFLADRADEATRLRHVSPAVFEALGEAGLLSVGPPTAFGGANVDIDTMFEMAYELGRGCASTAWCWAVWTLHSWYMGYAPHELQQELFAEGPDVIIASSYNPNGATVEMTDGGCLLSGSWVFSSGIDYARWIMLGALLPGMVRPLGAVVHWMLVPREQVRVIDNWHVMGLKASGSKAFAIDEPVFVPKHRFLEMHRAEHGPAMTVFGRPSYGVPNEVSIIHCTLAPFIGAAQAAIDVLSEDLRDRKNSLSGASKAEAVNIQLRIGEAAAEVAAARSLGRNDLREMLAFGATGRGLSLSAEERAAYRRNQTYNLLLARRAVTRLFEVSGTAGMFETSPMQRIFCDVYAISKHIFHLWDEHAENYGRVRLGLDATALQG